MHKRVRTLLRVSSRQQLRDNDIPIQRAEAEQYILSRPDWQFDGEYMEKAVSAYKNGVEDRAVLQEIMADAQKHEFDILLAYMSDRIGRQEEYSFYVAALNKLGIEVWTIKDGQLKTDDHIDKLLNYIRFWQNEGESKKTGMRVRDHQIELVKSGKFVGGKAPFGYRLVPSGFISNHGRALKKLEIVERDAAVVRKIYFLSTHCGMGYGRIANTLNEENIPPILTDCWKPSTIASILKNPIYMGYYALNRRINHGSFTRLDRKDWVYSKEQIPELVIIPKQEWERAQEIREARKAKVYAHTSEKQRLQPYENPSVFPLRTSGKLALTGLAYCGYCGSKLKNGSYYKYRQTESGECQPSFVGRYLCPEKCPARSCYSQNYLENAVFQAAGQILGQIQDVDISEDLQKIYEQKQKRQQQELDMLQRRKKSLCLDISSLEEKIPEAIRGDYFFSAEQLSSILEEKKQSLAALQEQEKILHARLQQMETERSKQIMSAQKPPDWKKEFQNGDMAVKQMLLFYLIDRIIVKDGDIVLKIK